MPLRALRLLSFCTALAASVVAALAQPTFNFDPQQQVGNVGEVRCLEIVVDDFTDLLSVDYDIEYDPAVLTWVNVSNVRLPGLSAASFTEPTPGVIRLSWTAPGAPVIGEDFPDFQAIAELCFQLVGPYGSSSTVEIADAPAPRVTRQFSGNRNIGLFTRGGLVAVGVLPLAIDFGTASSAEGSSVCVDVTARRYTDIVSFQHSVTYDPAVLSFTTAINFNADVPGLNSSAVVGTSPGVIAVVYPSGASSSAATLPDDAVLYSLCFDIVGRCDESSAVAMASAPVPPEAHNSQSNAPIPLVSEAGQVDVTGCGNGLRIEGATRTAAPGQTVCIPFTVSGFQNIDGLDFDITWNPGILTFRSLRVANGVPPGFGTGSFDQSGVAGGTLALDWGGIPWTMRNGQELFEICFEVAGSFGVNGVIDLDAVNGSVTQAGTEIGLSPRPGTVVILPMDPLGVAVGSFTGEIGDEVCVDLTVADFDNLQTVRFSLLWEPATLRFLRAENLALPNVQPGTFDNSSPGSLEFDYWDFVGADLADGDVLFSVCFQIVGTPGGCSPIDIVDFPRAIFVENAAAQGYNIGLDPANGEGCALDNRSFTLDVGDGSAAPPAVGCVPVTVSGYDRVERWTLSVAWNPAFFTYNSLNDLALAGIVADASEAAAGRLGLAYTAASEETLPDGTVAFELCFDPVGTEVRCSPILEEARPLDNFVRAEGRNMIAVVEGGQVCSEEQLAVSAVIVDETCPGSADGAVDITIVGGSGRYFFTWTPASGAAASAEDLSGLTAGTYTVTVRDQTNPSLQTVADYTVATLGRLPLVDAGPDTLLDCNAAAVYTLDGTGSDVSGSATTYAWRILQAGTSFVTGEQTLTPTIFGVGGVELTVDNGTCAARDTVYITRITPPTISVVEQGDIPCGGGEATLTVAVDPPGNYDFAWSTTDGTIASGTTASPSIIVTARGTYEVAVTDRDTGCEKRASVPVGQVVGTAVADAGDARTITCAETSVEIGGPGTSTGSGFTYAWSTPNGALTGPTTAPTVMATQPGRYFLEVRERDTGCESVDSVDVRADDDLPVVRVSADAAITCRDTSIELTGFGASATGLTGTWATSDGRLAALGATDSVRAALAPGTYTYTIENDATGCESSASVVVSDGRADPTVTLPPTFSLGCDAVGVIADVAYLGTDSLDYAFAWRDAAGVLITTSVALRDPVAGQYVLEVTDGRNGCSASAQTRVSVADPAVAAAAAEFDQFICGRDSIRLDLNGSSTDGAGLAVTWLGGQNPTPDASDPLVFFATVPGDYRPIVANADGSCADTLDRPIRLGDARTILPVEAGDDLVLACGADTVFATAAAPADPSIQLLWTSLGGRAIVDAGTVAAGFSESGTYVLTHTDPATRCTGRDTIVVTRATPQGLEVDAGPDLVLGCAQDAVTIDVAVASPSAGFELSWSVLSGTGAAPEGQAGVRIESPGVYEVTLTDPATSCAVTDTVAVTRATADDVTVRLPAALELDCRGTAVTLDASITATSAEYSLEWVVLVGTGATPVGENPSVNQPGSYELIVTYGPTGCQARDTVVVTAATRDFTLAATPLDPVNCGAPDALLTADFASAGSGPYSFAWSSLSGGTFAGPASTLTTRASSGDYVLVVTNQRTGCLDSVAVTLEDRVLPEATLVVEAVDSCSGIADLAAGVVADADVEVSWVVDGPGTLVRLDDKRAQLSAPLGTSTTVVYTLSTPLCPAFGTDSVELTFAAVDFDVTAQRYEVSAAAVDTTVDLTLANVAPAGAVYALDDDALGATLSEDGVLAVDSLLPGFTYRFGYTVCDELCPEQCAGGTVELVVAEAEPRDLDIEIPNAITPNGDGRNDAFVIDALLEAPEDFPKARLIVFNRWGDVLYSAQPYANDWDGTTDGGSELPQGTYYYVLELDFTTNRVYEGHVTVLR